MAGEITLEEVNGITKKVYDDSGVKKAYPASSVLQQRIKFKGGAKRIGDSYNVSVLLRPPNGFTYAGSSGAVKTLKQARNMVIKQASVTAFELDLREQVTFAALSRARDDGDAAFGDLVGTMMMAMKESASNREEMQFLAGQRGLGIVESITDNGGGLATLRITAASWSAGLWWAIGQEATLDSMTGTTKNNASGPLVTKDIDAENREVQVAYTGTLGSEITVGDTLYFEGAYESSTFNEMPGLIKQASAVSGTGPTGLNLTTYPNARGNVVNVAGNMSFGVFEQACRRLRERATEGKLAAYVPPIIYSELCEELKLQRLIDSSYSPSKGTVGHQSVEFATPKFGRVELVEHPFLWDSEFLVIKDADVQRVGSSDLDFGLPGQARDKGTFFERVSGTNACELVLFADEGCILKQPGHSVYSYGITHT